MTNASDPMGRKKKSKATALVVMGDEQGALSAASSVCRIQGTSEPLLVTPLLKLAPGGGGGSGEDPSGQVDPGTRAPPSRSVPAVFPTSFPTAGPLFASGAVGTTASSRPLFPSSAAAAVSHAPTSTLFPLTASGVIPAAPLFPSTSGSGSGMPASSFPGFGSFPGFPGSGAGGVGIGGTRGGGGGSFEEAVLLKMKREADRKRALQEAEAEG